MVLTRPPNDSKTNMMNSGTTGLPKAVSLVIRDRRHITYLETGHDCSRKRHRAMPPG